MLHQMCHEVLSAADIDSIRKARGFKEKETASRTTFESFFLSSIGLESVMAELTPKEVAALHLLSRRQDEVDITFFKRLYGQPEHDSRRYYGTFTQEFRSVFDTVKASLLRKGLLVMAEVKQSGESVQMERWRFRLPPEFVPFLPPLIQSPHRFETSGELRSDVIRHKLLEAMGESPAAAYASRAGFAATGHHGDVPLPQQSHLRRFS